jgi:hypothetical protein
MGQTNWKRVFLGGLVAGIIILVLTSATTPIAFMLRASTGQFVPKEFTVGDYAFGIIASLINGIVAVWLYSAIRPRHGAGPKTALIAGLFLWFFSVLLSSGNSLSATATIPFNVFLTGSLVEIVPFVVATLAGAWVYREQE